MRRTILLALTVLLAACSFTPTLSDPAEPLPTLPPTTPLPTNALIVFIKEGGLAFSPSPLTITADGSAHLEGSAIAATDWSITTDQLQSLTDQLNHAAFAALPYDPDPNVVCADCYVYTVNALTPQGVKSLQFDEAELDIGQDVSPRYKELVALMESIIKSAPLPQGQPPKPGDLPLNVLLVYNREGGFDYSNTALTLTLNGEATLDNALTEQSTLWTISTDSLASVTRLLNDPAVATLPFDPIVACDDCYVYEVTARTPEGIFTFKADDADLSNDQWPLFQQLIEQLELVKQNIP